MTLFAPVVQQLPMGGPNLEVFKFAVYLFVPIVSLVYFGDPAWYHTHVVPVSSLFLCARFAFSIWFT